MCVSEIRLDQSCANANYHLVDRQIQDVIEPCSSVLQATSVIAGYGYHKCRTVWCRCQVSLAVVIRTPISVAVEGSAS